MPTYKMPVNTITKLEASLNIKSIPDFLCIKIRHRETLLHGKKLIIFWGNIRKCHTSTIMSNTLPLFQSIRKYIFDSKNSSISCKYTRLMFYNSRKHSDLN